MPQKGKVSNATFEAIRVVTMQDERLNSNSKESYQSDVEGEITATFQISARSDTEYKVSSQQFSPTSGRSLVPIDSQFDSSLKHENTEGQEDD